MFENISIFDDEPSSVSSGQHAPNTDEINEIIKEIKSQVFKGYYAEKRYVPEIKDYRDVIIVSAVDQDLRRNFKNMKKLLLNLNSQMWIGITDKIPCDINAEEFERDSFCIWSKLRPNPFGYFWFRVRKICFRETEVMMKLEPIEPIKDNHERSMDSDGLSISGVFNESQDCLLFLKEFLYDFASKDCSRENFVNALRVGALVLLCLVAVLCLAMKTLGQILLKVTGYIGQVMIYFNPQLLEAMEKFFKTFINLVWVVLVVWQDFCCNSLDKYCRKFFEPNASRESMNANQYHLQ